jgi:hypothetical protein
MTTNDAIKLAGSRDALARLLGVATITTYRWKPSPPRARMYQLEVLRPEWFRLREDALVPARGKK